MFKTIEIIVMATLCLNFSANAQENKAIDVTTRGIQIGQKVPDVLIQNIYNYKTADSKSAIAAKLSDFKGKLIILDFWATWCSPCVAMIPKMDSLQQTFKDKVQFISITYQPEKVVLPFLEKLEKRAGKHYNIPVITDDKGLHKLFPHIYLPHYVWIDQDRIVKAITGYAEITDTSIESILIGDKPARQLVQKKDMEIAFNDKKPYLINGNGGDGSNLISHSVMTTYQEGLGGSIIKSFISDNKFYRISCINNLALNLIATAFSDAENYIGENRVVLKLKNPTAFVFSQPEVERSAWEKGNAFCYELVLPASSYATASELMQQDIKRLFANYNINLKTLPRKCWVLKRTSQVNKLKSKREQPFAEMNTQKCNLKNRRLDVFITQLNLMYLKKSPLPIIDGTKISTPIDMELNADMTSITSMNKALAAYDLRFEEEIFPIKVLEISDLENINVPSVKNQEK